MSVYSTIPADAIAELDARFSAIAAEIAQDDRPEPEPPTVGGATVKRAKYDGLTGAERANLRCHRLHGDGERRGRMDG